QVPDGEGQTRRLEEQRKRARAKRYFRYGDDGDGSIWFKGSLPHLEAEPLLKLVKSYAESERRAARDAAKTARDSRPGPKLLREHGSPAETTPGQRLADGLTALAKHHRGAPNVAGDRPRIVVTIRESDLRERAEQAGVLGSGVQIGAGELRR